MTRKKKPAPDAPPVLESCFIHGDYQDGVCPGCLRERPPMREDVPAPEPRLRTHSDEVSELRAALIEMLWLAVADAVEGCPNHGYCEDQGQTPPGPPAAVCAAVRALGWSEHFDAKAFEQRASR
jgi:hypothetical protein